MSVLKFQVLWFVLFVNFSPVAHLTLFSKKLTEGRVFATACAYWDLDKDRNQV